MSELVRQKLTQQERNALRAAKKEKDRLEKIRTIPESIHGIPVVEAPYVAVPRRKVRELRREFTAARKEFLKMLATTQYPALKKAGLSDNAVENMKRGMSPNGYNTHHKIPLAGGGLNVFDNFILIKNDPYHEDLHKILDPQICVLKDGERAVVKIPLPSGNVFIPPKQEEKTQNAEKPPLQAAVLRKIQKIR